MAFDAMQGGWGASGGSISNRLKMVVEMLLPCNIISLLPEAHQAQVRSLISVQLLSSLANLAGFSCLSACAACEVRFSGAFLERVASKAAHYASGQHYACVRDFLAHGQVGLAGGRGLAGGCELGAAGWGLGPYSQRPACRAHAGPSA
jgi:hypothetical protein